MIRAPKSISERTAADHPHRGPSGETVRATIRPVPAPGQVFPNAVDWDGLAPRGAWIRVGHPGMNGLLLVAAAVPALLLGAAVAVASAIAFRSPRRIFFVQPRVGLRGRVFRLVKFRTMREPVTTHFEAWIDGDRARVTRFGRFLRSTHLDELPQLINVLRGEMSFIGPRPEMMEVEAWACERIPGFLERLAIKPGITGLAQVVQGYTACDVSAYQRKLELNRSYLRRCSPALDLEILARTFLWMARGRGWKWNVGLRSVQETSGSRRGSDLEAR